MDILNYIALPVFCLEYNPAQGLETPEIFFCNKTTRDFTGYSKNEIEGQSIDFYKSIIHPDDFDKTTFTLSVLLRTELDNHTEFYRVKTKNSDDYRFVKGCCKIIRPLQKNKPTYFIATTFEATAEEIQLHFQ